MVAPVGRSDRMVVRFFRIFLVLFSVVFFFSCQNGNEKKGNIPNPKPSFEQLSPDFNEANAFQFIEKQLSFGPRVPNTAGHDSCGAWLMKTFEELPGFNVISQTGEQIAWDGKTLHFQNIIAAFQPEKKQRILLCAHWDTRPWAERDIEQTDVPIAGANDGASGVAVLLEIAQQLSQNPPAIGVDIVLFDIEDYGSQDPKFEDTFCYGSQYWSKNPHRKNYNARFGILLDMVGAKGATFPREGTSEYFAPKILDKVWKTAIKLGYSSYFTFQKSKPATDDHFYVNKFLGIKTIDILQRDLTTANNFPKHWHTHDDDIDIIDKKVLGAVGQTVLEVVYREAQGAGL